MSDGKQDYFIARIQSVPVDRELTFDIFLKINEKMTLFRKKGDVITAERMNHLVDHQLNQVFIPSDQRESYQEFLRELARDETLKQEDRGRYLKESAFNLVNDLFEKPDIQVLVEESESLVNDLVNFVSADLEALVSLMRLSKHDYYTYNHCVNVSVYSIAITKKVVGEDKSLLFKAGLGGLLHDLGKRNVSPDIINKPGKLDPQEWEEIKKHPDYGIKLLEGVTWVPEESRAMVLQHHENIDGKGYPRGLKGEEITQLSKIAAIADVFDALTSKRAYKDATTAQRALEIMSGMKGKFDEYYFKYLDKSLQKKKAA